MQSIKLVGNSFWNDTKDDFIIYEDLASLSFLKIMINVYINLEIAEVQKNRYKRKGKFAQAIKVLIYSDSNHNLSKSCSVFIFIINYDIKW